MPLTLTLTPNPIPPPNKQADDWQGMQEEAADEAERFAATLSARLRAEGNTALVSLRRPRDDGYATLVKLLAGQTDASKPVRVRGSGGELHAASEPGLARPMLDAASAPLLDALRNAFEFAEDAGHAALTPDPAASARHRQPWHS